MSEHDVEWVRERFDASAPEPDAEAVERLLAYAEVAVAFEASGPDAAASDGLAARLSADAVATRFSRVRAEDAAAKAVAVVVSLEERRRAHSHSLGSGIWLAAGALAAAMVVWIARPLPDGHAPHGGTQQSAPVAQRRPPGPATPGAEKAEPAEPLQLAEAVDEGVEAAVEVPLWTVDDPLDVWLEDGSDWALGHDGGWDDGGLGAEGSEGLGLEGAESMLDAPMGLL